MTQSRRHLALAARGAGPRRRSPSAKVNHATQSRGRRPALHLNSHSPSSLRPSEMSRNFHRRTTGRFAQDFASRALQMAGLHRARERREVLEARAGAPARAEAGSHGFRDGATTSARRHPSVAHDSWHEVTDIEGVATTTATRAYPPDEFAVLAARSSTCQGQHGPATKRPSAIAERGPAVAEPCPRAPYR